MSPAYSAQWRYRGSIIRQRGSSYQVETNLNGTRRRVTKPTKPEAEAYAKEMAEQAKAEGSAAIELSGKKRHEAVRALEMFPTEEIRQAAREALGVLPHPQQRVDVADALAILRGDVENGELNTPRSTPLAEAARFWLRHHPEGGTAPTIEKALAEYLGAKKHRRPATRYELKNKLGRFCKDFPEAKVVDITADDIDDWLTKNIGTLGAKRKHLTLLHTFFGFVRRKWDTEQNPTEKVYLDTGELDEVLPEAYSVSEVERMLMAAAAHEKTRCMVPALSIGLLAGLRPAELQELQWEDVDFGERHIRVTPQTAKRRRQRFVEMSDNLIAWLAPYGQESGPVSPPDITFRRRRANVIEAAGIPRWLRDGLRHTYASYHLAMYGDANKTAMEMGHRGNADLVYQHYRKLVKKSDAERFWRIRPAVEDAMQFPKTA